MKAIRSLQELPLSSTSLAVTIGNFDGLHLGHQSVLRSILEQCKDSGHQLVVITFTPHPHIILRGRSDFLLSTYQERRNLMAEMGVEILCEIEFNKELSELSAKDFLEQYVFSHLSVKKIFLGHDFAFGAGKKGGHKFVQNYCKEKDLEAVVLPEYNNGDSKISSTTIRDFISAGKIKDANALLGRKFSILGEVVHGLSRGEKLGFPTINLDVDQDLIWPAVGVYATSTEFDGNSYLSVTNIGHAPTFGDNNQLRIESHILDFSGDLYDAQIKTGFVAYLRAEKKFSSATELKSQISLDIKQRLSLNEY